MATRNISHSITVQASTQHLAEVRRFVGDQAESFGFDKEIAADIRLAVDEAFTNIINHAYNHDESQSVEIAVSHRKNTLQISLFDTGSAFSEKDYEQPDMQQKIKQKKRGGAGVYLIRKLMDKVTYRHEGPQNEIRMIKTR